jgi:hypothetical protein
MNNAKFKATLVDFKVNGKKTVLKLELSNTEASRNFGFLVGSLDEDVHVQLGDPQVSMEELGVKAEQRVYLPYSVQKDGTVDLQGDQEELDLEQETEESEQENDETEQEEGAEEGEGLEDLDFGEDETAQDTAGDEVEEGDTLEAKDDVEAFVLSGKTFGDEEVDWQVLLRRKKAGETWMELSKSLGITSSKLSTAWQTYKKRVKEYLNAEEEHGAA